MTVTLVPSCPRNSQYSIGSSIVFALRIEPRTVNESRSNCPETTPAANTRMSNKPRPTVFIIRLLVLPNRTVMRPFRLYALSMRNSQTQIDRTLTDFRPWRPPVVARCHPPGLIVSGGRGTMTGPDVGNHGQDSAISGAEMIRDKGSTGWCWH